MNKIFATLALGAILASSQAAAQAQAPRAGGMMDEDVTRQQTQSIADTMFQRFDVNHDGTVTREEAQQAASGFGNRGGRMLDRLFNGAQSLTLQQFEARTLARFDAMDSNHDGIVSVAERQQARAAMKAARGGDSGQ